MGPRLPALQVTHYKQNRGVFKKKKKKKNKQNKKNKKKKKKKNKKIIITN